MDCTDHLRDLSENPSQSGAADMRARGSAELYLFGLCVPVEDCCQLSLNIAGGFPSMNLRRQRIRVVGFVVCHCRHGNDVKRPVPLRKNRRGTNP